MNNSTQNNRPISIIMPAYNAEKFIRESITSVLQQTYSNWELIIVDDGSTDNTKKIIQAFAQQDGRIHYIYQPNGKQGKARNAGIRHASGDLIAFLDADDLWTKDKLEKQGSLIRRTNADLIFSDVEYSRLYNLKSAIYIFARHEDIMITH